jgi:hypothetical protein
MTCQPVHCKKCGDAIQCGDWCIDISSGTGRLKRHWQCGKRGTVDAHGCSSGLGRGLVYHCSTACYWRRRRARLRVAPKPRKCATCRKTFTPQRSDAKTCGSACRQMLYRRRLIA